MAMKTSTTNAVLWMDFYGLLRENGVSKFAAQKFLDSSNEAIQGATTELQSTATEGAAADRAIVSSVGDGLLLAAAAAAYIPVWGWIAGLVLGVIGGIMKALTSMFTFECDEWDCPSPKSFHRRGIVGVDIGNVWEGFHVLDDGKKCIYVHRRCTLYQYFHDGMVINGVAKKIDDPNREGRVVGCNGSKVGKYSKPLRRYWMGHRSNPQNVPKGNIGEPWNDTPTTRAARGWKVSAVLYWSRGKIPCRILSCMEEILKNTHKGELDTSEFDARRRRGSRWYSSIVWMMKDVWQIGQAIGSERFEQVLREQGESDAADEVKRIRTSRPVYEPQALPFPFWPVMHHISWKGLRKTLIAMKPMIPAEGPFSDPQPEGARRRTVKIGLSAILPQKVKSIIFDPKHMKPVPAKLGSRLPEWPVIAIGGVAAAVGALALYQLFKGKE